MHTVHTAISSQQYALSSASVQLPTYALGDNVKWQTAGGVVPAHVGSDLLFAHQDTESTSPTASVSVAAARWFDLLATEVTKEAIEETNLPSGHEAEFPDLFGGQNNADLTPLQMATRIVDEPQGDFSSKDQGQSTWQVPGNISLLPQEQVLFKNFLHGICPWVSDPVMIREEELTC